MRKDCVCLRFVIAVGGVATMFSMEQSKSAEILSNLDQAIRYVESTGNLTEWGLSLIDAKTERLSRVILLRKLKIHSKDVRSTKKSHS